MTLFFSLLLITLKITVIKADGAGHDWDYSSSVGALKPQEWYRHYPSCAGERQSPISVVDEAIQVDNTLRPLRFINYGQELKNLVMLNDGHTLKVSMPSSSNLTITSASLPAHYRLTQFHFHWASEHTINGVHYPLELHLVHANTRLSNAATLTDPKGLVVVSVMFDYKRTKGIKPSPSLQALAIHLGQTPTEGRSTTLETPVILEDLLPCDKGSYIRYSGSLTTPPCSEVIEFHIMTNTVPISHRDVNRFRRLQHEVERIELPAHRTRNAVRTRVETRIHNERPLQPLNGRVLRLSGDMGNFPTDL